ncbi:MAG TPA: LysR family transcriptional regulator [Novosphingobium capsulatum]|nr:LysR family transcriptional regulator [Novosphingobium capsulatum]
MSIEHRRDVIRDLTTFVVVARELNFTRAAAKLGVTQSALSYTIKVLEERIGVRLLTRTTRSVGLTEAGERLLDEAGRHLDGIEQVLTCISGHNDRPAGMVRIVASDHIAASVIQPAMVDVLTRYPEINLELLIDNAMADIVAERCDAGVRLGDHLASDMIVLPLGPELRMAAVATPAYFEVHGRPRLPADLNGHNCLAFRMQSVGNLYAWEFEKDGKVVSVRPQGQFVSNDPAQILVAALKGVGIAFMKEISVQAYLEDGRLERVMEDWCPGFGRYCLYYPAAKQPTAAFEVVLDTLRDGLQ